MRVFKFFTIIVASLSILTACGRNMDSAVYNSNAVAGKVLEGTVVSSRPVTIKDGDSAKKLGLGTIGGGAAGAVAGSGLGKGKGSDVAAIGVGILGAVVGSLIEDELSTSKGLEYVVRLDQKYVSSHDTKTKKSDITHKRGSDSIEQNIKDSIKIRETQSDLISVVQSLKDPIQPGQRVMIIYSDDRPRLVAF